MKLTRLSTEYALLLVLAVLWGSSYLFIKVALSTIPPFTLIAIRVTIAAIILGAVMGMTKRKLPTDWATRGQLLIQSFFNCIGSWTLLAWGQQFVDSGLAGVLNSTSPLFVFVITFFVSRHESLGRAKLAGAMVGLGGVILITGTEALEAIGDQLFAQLAILSGAILYACAAIYGKRFSNLPPLVTATSTMLWAVILLVPVSLIFEQPDWAGISMESIVALLILSVFCTAGAMMIYFRLVSTLGSLGVASQAYLRAGISVLLGFLFLGETFDWLILIGLMAAIIGVVAINHPTKPDKIER